MDRTRDGVEIVAGLRVFGYDAEWGTVVAPVVDGWWDVRLDSGRVALYDGFRMVVAEPGGTASWSYATS